MAAPVLFAQGLKDPHSLAFDIDEELFVAEASSGDLKKISPQGRVVQFANVNGQPAGLAFDDSDDLFVADSKRHQLLLLSLDEAVEVYAFQCKGKRFVGPHSLYFDTAGNLLFSDLGHSDDDGSIYSADLNGEVALLSTGLARPSGLVMSEDAAGLFVGESAANRIAYLEFNDDETLGPPQIFTEFDDGGSGIESLLFDTEGTLYVARSGVGICRLDPDGKTIDVIKIPGDHPAGMTFGGDNFDTLYVAESSTGSIYRLDAMPPGQRPFAGPRSV